MAKIPLTAKKIKVHKDVSKRLEKNLTPAEYRKRYPGMKTVPDVNHEYRRKLVVLAIRAKNRVRRKKVRSNESIISWERRMKRDGVMPEHKIREIQKTKAFNVKVIRQAREKDIKERNHANAYIALFFDKKHFDFLSYAAMIKQYLCVKHGIMKIDFDVAVSLYNNMVITPERFNNVCILNNGYYTGFLRRFKANNYIVEAEMQHEFVTKESKRIKTNIFKLNKYLSIIIGDYYKLIVKFEKLREKNFMGLYPPQIEEEFIKMNQEIEEYLDMNKKQELIK